MAKGKKKPHHSQDKWLIEQAKEIAELKQRLKKDTQEVYACFCKVLFEEYKWDFEQITELFLRTQVSWEEVCGTPEIENMIAWCEQVTDFSVVEGSDEQ